LNTLEPTIMSTPAETSARPFFEIAQIERNSENSYRPVSGNLFFDFTPMSSWTTTTYVELNIRLHAEHILGVRLLKY